MREVWVVDAVRTPIGKFLGQFRGYTAVDLGVWAVRGLIARTGAAVERIQEVVIGIGRQAGLGPNPARQIAVRAGIPEEVPALTVNQACGSSLRAIILASQWIRWGEYDLVIAGGTESMTRVPFLQDLFRQGFRLGHRKLEDGMYRDGFFCPLAEMVMGETAEVLAEMYGITREEADAYALMSHQRAERALKEGRFREELVPVTVDGQEVWIDEHIREGVTLEKLARLPPVFREGGTVTAGNASAITDGAAAVLLASEEFARAEGWTPLAVVGEHAIVGVDPRVMGIAPVPALRKLWRRTNSRMEDYGLYELNEAFATQVLAVLREVPLPLEHLNPNGGAIALGHPIGCTGARIVTTLLHEMRRRDVKNGVATLCISGGQGIALAFHR